MTQIYQVQEIRNVDRVSLIPSWRFHTSWAKDENIFQYPDHQAQLERFRWFLERHAAVDPLNARKASQIRNELKNYTQALTDKLFTAVIPPEAGFMDVYDDGNMSTFHSIPWELLEPCFSNRKEPVIVRRRASRAGTSHSSTASSPETFKILIVAARRKDDDGDYRQAALPILRLIQNLPDGAPLVTVEILRPGTFGALEERLTRSGQCQDESTYHLVHLDLHGGLDKKKKAHLFFTDRAVPAAKVSKVLVSHGVQYAIINACESARGDSGLQGNLAKTFVQEGIAGVLAMSYQLNISAVSFLTQHFYEAFFHRNMSFARAAHAARQAMREKPSRQGRFGLVVDLEDWIVPVVYVSTDTDYLVVTTKRVSKIQRRLPTLFRSVDDSRNPSPADLIGRDTDILQLEDKLLRNSQTGKGRLLFLDGTNGVGKTTLLRHIQWWWTSTDMVSRAIYVDLAKLRQNSPEAVCHHMVEQLKGNGPVEGENAMGRLQLLLEGMVKKSKGNAHPLYPRPLIILDHLWSTDWPFGKRSALMDTAEHEPWKKFCQTLSQSSAFVILASHRWPWYMDHHESSEFPPETYYVLDPIVLNRAEITSKRNGSQTVPDLIRNQRDVDHLELISDWCSQDLGLLRIIIPFVENIGAVKAVEILTRGEDVLEIPQFNSKAFKKLHTYKVAKKLWKNAPSALKQLLIAFAPFHGMLPRCYETYWKDFVINKQALLHPFRTRLAQFNPALAETWDQRLLRMSFLLVSTTLKLMPVLKSMGLIQAKNMMGPTTMNSGLSPHGHGYPEGSMLHSIHPVFSLFLRYKARKLGFLPSQQKKHSRKSVCLRTTFVNYHEKRSREWFDNQCTLGSMTAWDIDFEMKSCRASFAAAMDMQLQIPLELEFSEMQTTTPSYLVWLWTSKSWTSTSELGSRAHLIDCTAKALSRCQKELENAKVDEMLGGLVMEAAQLSMWLAIYHLLVSANQDKFVMYVRMTESFLDADYFRDTPQTLLDTLFPGRCQMMTHLDSLKHIRDAQESNECTDLTILANLTLQPTDQSLSSYSHSNGWNVVRKALTVTDSHLRLQNLSQALTYWNMEDFSKSQDAVYNEANEFLVELAPLWPEILSGLDSELLSTVRAMGFDENDDDVAIPDLFWDEVAVDLSSNRPPMPNYASAFMAAIRKGTPLDKVKCDFQNDWHLWVQSHGRTWVLAWFQMGLDFHDRAYNMEAALTMNQRVILSNLGDWELYLEHQQCLAVTERAIPYQELSKTQMWRLCSWYITTALCAFKLSRWDLCLEHINAVFAMASERRDMDNRQHFTALLVFALLQMTAAHAQPYTKSVTSALYQALVLSYSNKGIYARNGTILSLFFRGGESEYRADGPASELASEGSIAGLSSELHAHIDFLLSVKQSLGPDEQVKYFNAHADAIKDLQGLVGSFPRSSAFCRHLLSQLKARPAERQKVMSEAENHLFQHSSQCGCPFQEALNPVDPSFQGGNELLLVIPFFDLRATYVERPETPRMESIASLVMLWFKQSSPQSSAPRFTEDTEHDLLSYLNNLHEQYSLRH